MPLFGPQCINVAPADTSGITADELLAPFLGYTFDEINVDTQIPEPVGPTVSYEELAGADLGPFIVQTSDGWKGFSGERLVAIAHVLRKTRDELAAERARVDALTARLDALEAPA